MFLNLWNESFPGIEGDAPESKQWRKEKLILVRAVTCFSSEAVLIEGETTPSICKVVESGTVSKNPYI